MLLSSSLISAADYDLCTSCIESGSAERHNPFHEFLEIKEPGRVIVHTVYSGDGERDAQLNTSARAPAPAPAPAPLAEVQPAVHYATCNLCDSRIRGDRYVSLQSFDDCCVAKRCSRNARTARISILAQIASGMNDQLLMAGRQC
jgi:next-to-BRCA1 protein 1